MPRGLTPLSWLRRQSAQRRLQAGFGLLIALLLAVAGLAALRTAFGIELGGAIELVAFDRAFEVAKLRDDAVLIDGGRLCIRVEGSPAMN